MTLARLRKLGGRGGHGGGGHRGGQHGSSHSLGGGRPLANRGGGAVAGTTASRPNSGKPSGSFSRGRCFRCDQFAHRWFDCKARLAPAPAQVQGSARLWQRCIVIMVISLAVWYLT